MAFETINLGNQPTGTGGDTARSAFEKVNKNFITAEVLASSMSQTQFEAIRAQNNERYAASGFVHFGDDAGIAATIDNINNGLATRASASFNTTHSNKLWLGREDSFGRNVSKTNNPVVNISGVIYNILTTNGSPDPFDGCSAVIKFPQSPDGKTTYNKSTGANIVYATTTAAFNAAAVDVNLEVVTDRVDMWGFESFLEEVSLTNPYIYPNGIIQSLATTMDGITTVSSNRPVTYYAWFDGDASSKGKGVNYFTLTDAQKRKVLANHKNKLYLLDDGRLVQWRLRGRSFAGAGNSDWLNIESNSLSATYLQFYSVSLVQAQGYRDTSAALSQSNPTFRATNSVTNLNPLLGVFSVFEYQTPVAVNGECYFLVCGTVNRLNQGAYHPSLNASGSVADNTGKFWYNTTLGFTSQAACFDSVKIGVDVTGRPDGRLSKYIYASGQGGVCRDMRYSANHTTLEKFAEADLNVKNGTYRGFEKVVFTSITLSPVQTVTPSSGIVVADTSKYKYGDLISLVHPANGIVLTGTVTTINSATNFIGTDSTHTREAIAYHIVLTTLKPVSVGGAFMQADVIGNPANILQYDALKNGWYGTWIPVIATDSTSRPWQLNRKAVVSYLMQIYSTGGAWGIADRSMDLVNNGFSNTWGTSHVVINFYTAFAKQTEPTSKAVIHGGEFGLGSSRTSSNSGITYCNTLAESALGIILTGSGTNSGGESLTTLSNLISPDGTLSSTGVNHVSMKLPAPLNGSKGIKALDYNVNINQQAFKQYAATEMKWNGTSWGDDSQIHIVDGENTLTDLNGNTVKVVTHKLKEPIGWIKNTV